MSTPIEPDNGLTRITVNLRQRAVDALDALCGEGVNRTDAINGALIQAAHLQRHTVDGVLHLRGRDGIPVEVIQP